MGKDLFTQNVPQVALNGNGGKYYYDNYVHSSNVNQFWLCSSYEVYRNVNVNVSIGRPFPLYCTLHHFYLHRKLR